MAFDAKHGHGHHMPTLFPKAINLRNTLSSSFHLAPGHSPARPRCSWPLTLPSIAGALPNDNCRAAGVHH